MLVVVLVGGCGPRVVLDEDDGSEGGDEAGTSAASTSSGSSESSDDSGAADDRGDFPPPDPGTSTGSPGADESTGVGDSGTIELCPEIEAESVYCLSSSFTAWFLIGADTGMSCAIDLPLFDIDTHSIAWLGDDVFACPRDGSGNSALTRIRMLDGSIDAADVACEAVAGYHGGLLVLPSVATGPLNVYDSFDAAVSGAPSMAIDVDPFASRMTVSGDRLFAAWHSTAELEVWDLGTQSQLESVPLEGHDGWVNGIAVVDNRLFLVTSSPADTFIEFDATTGARVTEYPVVAAHPSGLACRRGG
jgi:hypothetical protein